MYASSTKFLICFLFFSAMTFAQQNDKKKTVKDTLVFKQKYGLRLGADLSKLAKTFLSDDYTGFEIMGDYRLTKRIYLAGELGTEERTISNELLDNTTKGSYFKGGVDINFYKNWLDMENMIYAGFRVGASTFSQTLNSFDVYNFYNQYWNEGQLSFEEGREFSGLTAIWGELIVGIKAEVLNNLYAGLNVQLKVLASENSPSGYENLYIPGFNRTYDSGRFGTGFGVNLAYLVPIFKKDKVVIEEREVED